MGMAARLEHVCMDGFKLGSTRQARGTRSFLFCAPSTVSLLYLSRLTVHAGQQQPGGLPHVVAVYGEAASMLSVGDRHPDPLHQWRQYQERPAGGNHRSVCARKSIQISKVKGIRCLIQTVAFQRVQNRQTKNVLYVSHVQKNKPKDFYNSYQYIVS